MTRPVPSPPPPPPYLVVCVRQTFEELLCGLEENVDGNVGRIAGRNGGLRLIDQLLLSQRVHQRQHALHGGRGAAIRRRDDCWTQKTCRQRKEAVCRTIQRPKEKASKHVRAMRLVMWIFMLVCSFRSSSRSIWCDCRVCASRAESALEARRGWSDNRAEHVSVTPGRPCRCLRPWD